MALARIKTWVSGEVLLASDLNSEFNNVLNNALTLIAPLTASLNAGGFKLTSYGTTDVPSARSDAPTVGQVQDSIFKWCGTATGTANAIALTSAPAITAYAAGQSFVFKSASTNTAATTVAISGLATKAIQSFGVALVGGEIAASRWYRVTYDGAAFQLEAIAAPYYVSAKGFGATGDGSTDDTTALQAAIDTGWPVFIPPGTYKTTVSLTQSSVLHMGQRIFGAGCVRQDNGTGTNKTIIQPSAAVSVAIAQVGSGTSVRGAELSDFTIDMTNMTDASTRIGIRQNTAFENKHRNITFINQGTNKRCFKFEAGAYLTIIENCRGTLVELTGNSLADAVTTLMFQNCDFDAYSMTNASGISVFGGAVQGTANKFTLASVEGLTITGCDIEGSGTYLVVGASCKNIYSAGNFWGGFSGTYSSGNVTDGWFTSFDSYNSANFNSRQAINVSSGAALALTRTSSGDRMILSPLGAGSGSNISSQNAAEGDYTPLGLSGNAITLQSRSGAGTLVTVASFAQNLVTVTGAVTGTGVVTAVNATAIPAGGTAGYKFSSTSNFGVFFGSGAPSATAAKGSLYLRSDGTGTSDRMYVNTDGSTTWTAVTTAA